jgi:hypothetical protein
VSTASPADATNYRTVAQAILGGHVVPVLGAGANLCDRAPGEAWEPHRTLPNGSELAELLADQFSCDVDEPGNLLRVSQAAALAQGYGPVFGLLHRVFTDQGNTYQPTSLHRFLAGLPALRARRGQAPAPQLIVTTNYDDLLERAFADAGEPVDVVYYLAQGESRQPGEPRRDQGRVVHVDPDGNRRVVRTPKTYVEVTPETRTVILKLHGTVRTDDSQDSWVITEDHYIDYLTRTNLSELIPVKLLEKLLSSNFLFLGYAMKDWNMRVMLHRIWMARDSSWESWAVQLASSDLDTRFWADKHVSIHSAPLRDYLDKVQSCLETVPVGF